MDCLRSEATDCAEVARILFSALGRDESRSLGESLQSLIESRREEPIVTAQAIVDNLWFLGR